VELSLLAQKGWPRLGSAQDRLRHAQELRALLCSHLHAARFMVEVQWEVGEKDVSMVRAPRHHSQRSKKGCCVVLVQVTLLVDGKQLRCTLVQHVEAAVANLPDSSDDEGPPRRQRHWYESDESDDEVEGGTWGWESCYDSGSDDDSKDE
jgi:hypothetical protein